VPKKQLPEQSVAERLVVMGRVVAPYGVNGWIKVQPFTQESRGLLDYSSWQVGREGAWQPRSVETAKVHGAAVVAKLAGISDRDQAALLQGMRIAISRNEFPAPASGEFYWADLMGLRVVNETGVELGTVSRVFETGANDVLVVEDKVSGVVSERLLPFIETVIRKVDFPGGKITVDWEADY
jgi:16S rRNA processing protein RimM